MQATNIRIHGKRPTKRQLKQICTVLYAKFQAYGFLADACIGKSNVSLKIGGHMCQFRINTFMHGHNARLDDSPKGYKRTNVPTWKQRVEFNRLVNQVLDSFGVTCHLKSGPLTIREVKFGAHTSWDRHAVWTRGEVVTLAEAEALVQRSPKRPSLQLIRA